MATSPWLGCQKERTDGEDTLHGTIASTVRNNWAKKNVRLRVLHPKGSRGNLTPIVSQFKALTGLEIELQEGSLDEISAEILFASKLGGKNFDVALPATFGLPDLAEAGAILKLNELAARYEPKDFSASSIYRLGDRYHGDLYGYQTDGDAYLMFYLKDCFSDREERDRFEAKYGESLEIPQTWEALDRQMQFFHRPDQQRYGGSLYRHKNYAAWEFWSRFHAKGLFPFSPTLEPQLDSEAGIEALSEMVEATQSLRNGTLNNALFENWQEFAQGQSFCNIGWGGTQKYLQGAKSKVVGRIQYGLIPGGVLQGKVTPMPYFNWGWNFVISKHSLVPELAYHFILFATSPKISTLSVREPSGYFDPFRKEHYQDAGIQDTYGKEFLQVHQKSLENCIPDLYLRGQGQYLSALRNAIHGACHGHMPPKLALRSLSDRWKRITQSVGVERQTKQWELLRNSYPTHLQRVLS